MSPSVCCQGPQELGPSSAAGNEAPYVQGDGWLLCQAVLHGSDLMAGKLQL